MYVVVLFLPDRTILLALMVISDPTGSGSNLDMVSRLGDDNLGEGEVGLPYV
jgi:hypothetical protein